MLSNASEWIGCIRSSHSLISMLCHWRGFRMTWHQETANWSKRYLRWLITQEWCCASRAWRIDQNYGSRRVNAQRLLTLVTLCARIVFVWIGPWYFHLSNDTNLKKELLAIHFLATPSHLEQNGNGILFQ
jgi:hypothetical protein